MALVKTVFPYEFLARWDYKTGALQGYHLKVMTRVTDGGVEIARDESAALSATAAASVGFDFSAILETLHTGALIAVDETKAQAAADVAAANKARDEAVAEAKAETADRDERIADLEKQNAELTAVVVPAV